jgi:hypothetical protein
MHIRHVVNTIGPSARPDLLDAQRLTLSTMERAIRSTSPEIEIEVVGVRFPDEGLPAPWLVDGWTLDRSVADLGTFTNGRRLPLLADLLDPLASGEFDLGVFTNIDIALQPHFYDLVAEIHENGHDAFTINRRTVHSKWGRNSAAWLASQTGVPHPGHDCFVFTPEVLKGVDVDDLCIGAPFVARGLIYNLILGAQNFRQFVDLNATFHVGDDRMWTGRKHHEYASHNGRAFTRVVSKLIERYGEAAVGGLPAGRREVARASGEISGERMTHPRHGRQLRQARTFDNRRLMFAASPGRSGTKFLAQLLGSAESTLAFHEGKPNMAGEFLRAVAYRPPADSYQDRMLKVRHLRDTLRELPERSTVIDTTHMFIKTFADVVLDEFNHDRITILDLRRPLLPLIGSMMDLGWFTAWAPKWRDWLIPPTAPGSLFPISSDRVTSRVDVALGYVLDSKIRTRSVRAVTPHVRWVDVMVERLADRREIETLFSEIRLEPTAATFDTASHKVNVMSELKGQRNVGMSEERLAEEIASFAERFSEEIADADMSHIFEGDGT